MRTFIACDRLRHGVLLYPRARAGPGDRQHHRRRDRRVAAPSCPASRSKSPTRRPARARTRGDRRRRLLLGAAAAARARTRSRRTLAGFKTFTRDGVTVTVESTSRVDLQAGGRRGRGEPSRCRRTRRWSRPRSAHARHRRRSEEDRRAAAERPQLHAARHAAARRGRAAGGARRRRPATRRPAASARRPSGFSVNGMRNQSNNFLLDGASNNDTFNTGFVLRPPPDAIQEFKILTHSYSAEYGRNAGSVVNVVTRARHQPAARRRLGVQSRRRAAGAQLLRAADAGEAEAEAEPVRRQPRRAAAAQPAVRLRLLRGLPQHERHTTQNFVVLTDAQRDGQLRQRRRSAIR